MYVPYVPERYRFGFKYYVSAWKKIMQHSSHPNFLHIFFGMLGIVLVGHAVSQTHLEENKTKSWFVKEFEPHKIIGNLFYIGGCHLAPFLIT
tara:strand:- start:424 stop:699 length:276 start_codon:yes stop_codon:yes gene_type:complete